MDVLYLGISGVLHPSESMYRLLHGRAPWADGHAHYEAVPVLERALKPWPDVRIVLTSTQPWAHGLPAVLRELGPLGPRVEGFTFEDLTTKAVWKTHTRGGATGHVMRSAEDYWRMNKSGIVNAHVQWLRPAHWVAVDDEDILWPEDVLRNHVVLTQPDQGLLDPAAEDRLLRVMRANFSGA